ncbi:competence protein CoiA family protein [Embleya sp. NPDC020886]|uniref:competence protein CoiA family protein n=1 Tax=Embleya sp. NPDC020886 TaxID=3363980 RepID=UPI0037999749
MLDATLPDLGCGRRWEEVHVARPRAPLTCPACAHGSHAKISPRGLRFFAHDPGAPCCRLAEESLEHHLLKLELLTAVRDAGWFARLEVAASDGSWRADVLATSPDGTHRMAWEAQLSPIGVDAIRARTAKLARDDVTVCWVAPAPKPGTPPAPWLDAVPAVEATPTDTDTTVTWTLTHGLRRFAMCVDPAPGAAPRRWWEPVEGVPLSRFVGWVLKSTVTRHQGRGSRHAPTAPPPLWWTARHYITLEREAAEIEAHAEAAARDALIAQAEARQAELDAESDRHRAAEEHARRRKALADRAGHWHACSSARREQLTGAVHAWAEREQLRVQVVFGAVAPHWAGGVAVLDGASGAPVATLTPARGLLDGLDPALTVLMETRTQLRDILPALPPYVRVERLQVPGESRARNLADFLVAGPAITDEMFQRPDKVVPRPRAYGARVPQPRRRSRSALLLDVTAALEALARGRFLMDGALVTAVKPVIDAMECGQLDSEITRDALLATVSENTTRIPGDDRPLDAILRTILERP